MNQKSYLLLLTPNPSLTVCNIWFWHCPSSHMPVVASVPQGSYATSVTPERHGPYAHVRRSRRYARPPPSDARLSGGPIRRTCAVFQALGLQGLSLAFLPVNFFSVRTLPIKLDRELSAYDI